MVKHDDIVFFELNNWFCGRDYPDAEPFIGWMMDDLNIKFRNEEWVKENKLCVVVSFVDMSQNFCITAKKSWVEENCPELLTKYTQFIRDYEEDDDEYSHVEGRFGHLFLDYEEENIGITWVDDEDYYSDDEDDEDSDDLDD